MKRMLIALPLLLGLASAAVPTAAQTGRPISIDVGEEAPALHLPSIDGGRVDLAALSADGPVVVVFFRGWVGYW